MPYMESLPELPLSPPEQSIWDEFGPDEEDRFQDDEYDPDREA